MLQNYCRLCLSTSSLRNVFEENKERLNELFNIKYDDNTQLPQNICEYCWNMVDKFSTFVQNVQLCELEIQRRFSKLCEMVAVVNENCAGLNDCEGIFEAEKDSDIVEVDPYQEVESSDEDFSMESDSEFDQVPLKKEKTPAIENYKPAITANQVDVKPADSYSPDLTTKNAYLCKICDRAFTSQHEQHEHESYHNPAAPYSCNFCQFHSVSRQTLIGHIKELHDAERPYICALCQKGFCRRSDLKKHTIVHTGVRPFTCSICAKSFSRNTNLTKHMRIHSSVKPHVCQHCPRSFCTTNELMRHSALHTDVKTFQCSYCPSSFMRRDKLQLHEQTHLVDSELNLIQNKTAISADANQLNDFTGSTTNNIKTQQQSRSNATTKAVMSKQYGREFNCEICGRSFMRERDLQRHKALHLDSLFSCKHCGSGFARREKLLKHELEVHGVFKCKDCQLTFSNKNSLDFHMKTHIVAQSPAPLHTAPSPFPLTANNIQQNQQQANDFSFYSKMPSIALGFYSEVQTEDT